MTSAIRAHREAEDGFTLIELLVVVIIIGILAAIAIPAFLNQREGAWRSSVESDLRNAAIALETYYSENDDYPDGTTVTAIDETTADLNLQLSAGTVLADLTTPGIVYDDDGSTFCLHAYHQELTGVVATYDSNAGGITTAAVCAD